MTIFSQHVGREELLFSIKTFLASVLALWLALRFALPNPYWAMATVYVIAQPLAGAVTSKALFRVLGTFMGAAAAVALVPALVETPEMLCLALALWTGVCLAISLHDRTPRSYVFLLGGYTAAIIGFQSVTAPEAVFNTALARVEEITIGILCSALASRIIFPRHAGPLLAARIDAWLDDAGCWAVDVLSGRRDAEASHKNLWCLATDTFGMLPLTTHLPYDTSPLRYAAGQIRVLQHRMTAMLPVITGISEQLSVLERAGGGSRNLPLLLADIARWIASGKGGAADDLDERRLRLKIARITRRLEERGQRGWTWRELLLLDLMARLRELVVLWTDCLTLRQDIMSGNVRIPRRLRAVSRFSGESALHRDTGTAMLSGCAAAVGTLLCSAFWITTGWRDGASATLMCATLCSLFASLDNPVPVLKKNAWDMLACLVFSGIYMVAIIPLTDDFIGLVVLMAPFLLFFGCLVLTPKWGTFSILACLNLPLMLLLQPQPTFDFAQFLNGNISSIFGVIVATVTTAAMRSIGVEQSIRRLLRANRADIARLLEQARPRNTIVFMRRLVDRFGLLVQRVAALPDEPWNDPSRILRELRIGLNIVDLQMMGAGLPQAQREEVSRLLQELRTHFKSKARNEDDGRAAGLLRQLDETVSSLAAGGGQALGTRCLRALVGIRCGLMPDAPAFQPIVQEEYRGLPLDQ